MSKDHPDAETSKIEMRLRGQLGDQLRRHYGSVVTEPVPSRLRALLDELDKVTLPPTAGRR